MSSSVRPLKELSAAPAFGTTRALRRENVRCRREPQLIWLRVLLECLLESVLPLQPNHMGLQASGPHNDDPSSNDPLVHVTL